ncbi:hypothetical protein ACFQY7_19680 [Actinomadura luteofluorescens]|uniref:hypothetical protein n=1 Tax=Actinomadura luteofluorescens TaxID=46163 RepID=UPI00364059DF
MRALVANVQTSGPQTDRVRKAAAARASRWCRSPRPSRLSRDYVAWMDGTIAALQRALA